LIQWSFKIDFVFYMGVLAQTAYLADPSKKYMHVAVFLVLMLVPYTLLLFFRKGEFSPNLVRGLQYLAGLWYLGLAGLAVALCLSGYRPHGWMVFLVLMAPGAALSAYMLWRGTEAG
jgi:hypothetical protein